MIKVEEILTSKKKIQNALAERDGKSQEGWKLGGQRVFIDRTIKEKTVILDP